MEMTLTEMIQYLTDLKETFKDGKVSFFLEGKEPKKLEAVSFEPMIGKEKTVIHLVESN